MEIVLVRWRILPGREDEFKAYRKPIPSDTHGFLGERLYRAVEDDDEMGRAFVNIGRWERREDFYKAFGDSAIPGKSPPMQPFEAAYRRREWLAVIAEDSDCPT